MTEDVLEGADVGIGIEEMGGEAVSEGVAGDPFGDGGFFKGFFELPLHGVLEEVVTGEFPSAGVGAELRGGEEKAPRELESGIWIFSLKGKREVDGGAVIFEVVLVLRPELFKLDPEMGLEGFREGDDAMLAAFGIVDLDGVVIKIEARNRLPWSENPLESHW